MATILETQDLFSGYGPIEILKGVNVKIEPGKIVSLIGSNGAGKTTFLMTVSGLVRAHQGSIHFEGMDISKSPPNAIVKRGVVQVPEGRRIFPHLTVSENLDLGAYTRKDSAQEINRDKEEMLALFPILKQRLRGQAGNLSGGEQQMLAMARALMARPKLLLLDEPSLGLAPKLIETIFELILKIRDKGLTILLVEQNAWKALELADYAYVIESGQIQMEGVGKELLSNPQVKEAYLGS